MRSLPLVLVIFWFYFLVPYIGQWVTGASRPIRVGAFTSALVTFILFEAAYFSEIMRAGIQSISTGPAGGGHALGLTYGQSMRYVVLPQAFRNMLPVLLTQTIVLFQDTSLVYVLVDHRLPRRRQQGRAARRPAGRDVSVRGRRLLRHFLSRVLGRPAPAGADGHHPVRSR